MADSPLGDSVSSAGSISSTKWKVDEQRQRQAGASLYQDILYFDGLTSIYTGVERTVPSTFEAWMYPTHFENEAGDFIYGKVPFRSVVGLLCGTALSAEDLAVLSESTQRVSPNEWSHVAAVFGDEETRFYLNGKLVATGPAPEQLPGPYFVIGRVGNGERVCKAGSQPCKSASGKRFLRSKTLTGSHPEAQIRL